MKATSEFFQIIRRICVASIIYGLLFYRIAMLVCNLRRCILIIMTAWRFNTCLFPENDHPTISSDKRNKNSRKKWHLFLNKSKVQHFYTNSCGHAYKFGSKNLLISFDQFENVAHIYTQCLYSGIKRNFRKFTPYNKLEI